MMWKVGQETRVEAQGRRNVPFSGRTKNIFDPFGENFQELDHSSGIVHEI